MFRNRYPIAWAFHRQTSRWPFNMHGLNNPAAEIPKFKEDPEAQVVRLTAPELPSKPLAGLLSGRSSTRRFAKEPLPVADLSALLYSAYGVRAVVELAGEFCERPVPSGGGLYPLELYLIAQNTADLAQGVYHFVPLGHFLEVVREDPLPAMMTAEMFLGQPYLIDAAAIVVITGMLERSMWKYEDRGYRYILLEAGHVAQNLNLCAEGLALGSLNLGGFLDEDVASLLALDTDYEVPLYAVALGPAATGDPRQRRFPAEENSFRQY